jgi:quercetin dioxygenase-like cupin family protein
MCTNPKGQVETAESPRVEIIENPTNKVLLSSEIVFEKLNPARGNQSPQAGTRWGDRNGTEATGFLAKFVDGFSSPPHIHNVTYRAVVIKGLIHNDDEHAEKMWMRPGSFWTQPVGEAHITAAKGEENIALVEIDNGPYLVHPTEQAFDNDEKPINVDVTNIAWLNNDKSNWIDASNAAEISFLWESQDARGLFIRLPQRFNGVINSDGSILHAVVIQGELNYTLPQSNLAKTLDPGSYFGAESKAKHSIANNSKDEVIVYIRTNGNIIVK